MSAFGYEFCSLVQEFVPVWKGDDGSLFGCTQAASLGYVAVAWCFLVDGPFYFVICVVILEAPNVFG